MNNRIFVRNFEKDTETEIDPGETIHFKCDDVDIRVYFTESGDLRISSDERVEIAPEASNVFVIRNVSRNARGAALRLRKSILADPASISIADISALIAAALR